MAYDMMNLKYLIIFRVLSCIGRDMGGGKIKHRDPWTMLTIQMHKLNWNQKFHFKMNCRLCRISFVISNVAQWDLHTSYTCTTISPNMCIFTFDVLRTYTKCSCVCMRARYRFVHIIIIIRTLPYTPLTVHAISMLLPMVLAFGSFPTIFRLLYRNVQDE